LRTRIVSYDGQHAFHRILTQFQSSIPSDSISLIAISISKSPENAPVYLGPLVLAEAVSVDDFQTLYSCLSPEGKESLNALFRLDSFAQGDRRYLSAPSPPLHSSVSSAADERDARTAFETYATVLTKELIQIRCDDNMEMSIVAAAARAVAFSLEREFETLYFDMVNRGNLIKLVVFVDDSVELTKNSTTSIAPSKFEEKVYRKLTGALKSNPDVIFCDIDRTTVDCNVLGTFIFDTITTAINKNVSPSMPHTTSLGWHDDHCIAHEIVEESRGITLSNRGVVDSVLKYIKVPKKCAGVPPLAIKGSKGGGVSTVMAAVSSLAGKSDAYEKPIVVSRFVRQSPPMTFIPNCLQSICEELAERIGTSIKLADIDDKAARLRALLSLSTHLRPIIVLIDGIDQFEQPLPSLTWLPFVLPPFSRVVVSLAMDSSLRRCNWSDEVSRVLPSSNVISASSWDKDRTVSPVKFIFESNAIKPTTELLRTVELAATRADSVLDMRAIVQHFVDSFYGLNPANCPPVEKFDSYVNRSIDRLLRKFERETIRKLFGLLLCSRFGLDVSELLSLLFANVEAKSVFQLNAVIRTVLNDCSLCFTFRRHRDCDLISLSGSQVSRLIAVALQIPPMRQELHSVLAVHFKEVVDWVQEASARNSGVLKTGVRGVLKNTSFRAVLEMTNHQRHIVDENGHCLVEKSLSNMTLLIFFCACSMVEELLTELSLSFSFSEANSSGHLLTFLRRNVHRLRRSPISLVQLCLLESSKSPLREIVAQYLVSVGDQPLLLTWRHALIVS
jgi:hypothetical protein